MYLSKGGSHFALIFNVIGYLLMLKVEPSGLFWDKHYYKYEHHSSEIEQKIPPRPHYFSHIFFSFLLLFSHFKLAYLAYCFAVRRLQQYQVLLNEHVNKMANQNINMIHINYFIKKLSVPWSCCDFFPSGYCGRILGFGCTIPGCCPLYCCMGVQQFP